MKQILSYFISAIWLAFLAILALTPTAYGAIAFVQVATSSVPSGSATVVTSTITASAGNTILVLCVTYNGAAPTITSVTDGTNTYQRDAQASGKEVVALYRTSNVSAGTYTVACNQPNQTTPGIYVLEYSGIANTNPVDASSSDVNDSNNTKISDPGAITTSNANDFIFGGNRENIGPSSFVALAPGFTLRGNLMNDGSNPGVTMENIVSATGTYDATSSWTSVMNWGAVSVAYKAAAAAAAAATGPTTHLIRKHGRTRGATR